MAVIEPPHLLAAHRRGLRCVVLGDPFLWGGLEGMREMAGAARLLGLTPAVHSFYESAVAAAAAAVADGWCEAPVTVVLPAGGELLVELDEDFGARLIGPVEQICRGETAFG